MGAQAPGRLDLVVLNVRSDRGQMLTVHEVRAAFAVLKDDMFGEDVGSRK